MLRLLCQASIYINQTEVTNRRMNGCYFLQNGLVTGLRICWEDNPKLSSSPRDTECRDDRYNVNYYYQRQADFEQETDEEISGEDQIRLTHT